MMVERITPLGRLMMRLAPLDTEDRIDAVLNEISSTGGPNQLRDKVPALDGVTNLFEIRLHGVEGLGIDTETAVARWIGAAGLIVFDVEALAHARQTVADPDADDAARIDALEIVCSLSGNMIEWANAQAELAELRTGKGATHVAAAAST